MKKLMFQSEYQEMYRSEETLWWYRGLRALIFRYLQTRSRKIRIFDAGCGNGKTIQFLNGKGFKVYGVDLSKQAIALCRKRGVRTAVLGDITNLNFKDRSFDIVLCIDVLGMLSEEQRVKAIKELHRVLSSKGILIAQFSALPLLWSQHDRVIRWKKRFVKGEIEKLFCRPKWEISKLSYRVFFLFLPVLLQKIVKKLTVKKGQKAKTDQFIPPFFLNKLLTFIQLYENWVFTKIDLPIGSSLFLVAQKSL